METSDPAFTTHRSWGIAADMVVVAMVVLLYLAAFLTPVVEDIHTQTSPVVQILQAAAIITVLVVSAVRSRQLLSNKKVLFLLLGALFLDVILGKYFTDTTGVLLYLDTFGLVAIVCLFGTRLGLVHASIYSLILAIADPTLMFWAPVNFVVAWCVGAFRAVGGMSNLVAAALEGLTTGAAIALLVAPVNIRLLGPMVTPGDANTSLLLNELKYTFGGSFLGYGVSEPLDKLITFIGGSFLAYVIVSKIARNKDSSQS